VGEEALLGPLCRREELLAEEGLEDAVGRPPPSGRPRAVGRRGGERAEARGRDGGGGAVEGLLGDAGSAVVPEGDAGLRRAADVIASAALRPLEELGLPREAVGVREAVDGPGEASRPARERRVALLG